MTVIILKYLQHPIPPPPSPPPTPTPTVVTRLSHLAAVTITPPHCAVWPFTGERVRVHDFASNLLWKVCLKILDTTDSNHCYTNPIFEATRLNVFQVVEAIALLFSNIVWSTNEDGHNFIQYAVINRSEKIYNLLYQMSEHKNIYKTIKDSSRNNLLHLAARLAPSNKLNLISGAALQLQRELQWFKEVEGFVRPLNKIQKKSSVKHLNSYLLANTRTW